jgi:hypothetical protein
MLATWKLQSCDKIIIIERNFWKQTLSERYVKTICLILQENQLLQKKRNEAWVFNITGIKTLEAMK